MERRHGVRETRTYTERDRQTQRERCILFLWRHRESPPSWLARSQAWLQDSNPSWAREGELGKRQESRTVKLRAETAAENNTTQHTSWVQTGLYLN